MPEAQVLEPTLDWAAVELARRRNQARAVAGQVLVPTFQLDEGFGLDLVAASVVARLTAAGMGAWEIWDWVTHPNGWLHGRRPQDLLHEQSDAVARAIDGLLQE